MNFYYVKTKLYIHCIFCLLVFFFETSLRLRDAPSLVNEVQDDLPGKVLVQTQTQQSS